MFLYGWVKYKTVQKVSSTLVIVVLLMSFEAGCAAMVVPKPGEITLSAAMKEVAEGLNNMYEIRKDHPRSGLLPSEVTVVFNISAKGTDSAKLVVESGATATDMVKIVKAGADLSTSLVAERGNTITVKFTNLLFAPKDLLVSTMKPDDVKKLIDALHQVGFETLFTTKELKSTN